MKKHNYRQLFWSICFFAAFIIWTLTLCHVDVQAIGPNGSCVGLASINNFFHHLTGVHMSLYHITDWLGLIPIFTMIGFAITGMVQLIRRKSIRKVDKNLIHLGIFYIVVFAAYFFFEKFIINYRPILINGLLEASYPSSTTMLVLCVMPTSALQLKYYIKSSTLRNFIIVAIAIFTIFMVIGRLISGVHWFSDIFGGILLSSNLTILYSYIVPNFK